MTAKQEFLRTVFKDFEERKRKGIGVPVYAPFGDEEWFYIAKPISWIAEGDHKTKFRDVRVPSGFVTDLASIPQIFWPVMPRDGKYLPAAIVHDYLYWRQDRPRQDADMIFNIGMSDLKVGSIKRGLIYHAVKWGGEIAWRSNQNLKAQGERRVLKRTPGTPQITWSEWKQQDDVFEDHDGFEENLKDR